jgi:hypothetical protein
VGGLEQLRAKEKVGRTMNRGKTINKNCNVFFISFFILSPLAVRQIISRNSFYFCDCDHLIFYYLISKTFFTI